MAVPLPPLPPGTLSTSKLFASCSADWTVKLWLLSQLSKTDKQMSFDLNVQVGDLSWTPWSSTTFAACTADGKVHVFDLNENKSEAMCTKVGSAGGRRRLKKGDFFGELAPLSRRSRDPTSPKGTDTPCPPRVGDDKRAATVSSVEKTTVSPGRVDTRLLGPLKDIMAAEPGRRRRRRRRRPPPAAAAPRRVKAAADDYSGRMRGAGRAVRGIERMKSEKSSRRRRRRTSSTPPPPAPPPAPPAERAAWPPPSRARSRGR